MSRASGAARMVANMLERDGTPVRIEAAQELMTAVNELEKQKDALEAAVKQVLPWLMYDTHYGRKAYRVLYNVLKSSGG